MIMMEMKMLMLMSMSMMMMDVYCMQEILIQLMIDDVVAESINLDEYLCMDDHSLA